MASCEKAFEVPVTPQNVILTQNVIAFAGKCNINAKCNKIGGKCNKSINAKCNNSLTQNVINSLAQNVITQNVITLPRVKKLLKCLLRRKM